LSIDSDHDVLRNKGQTKSSQAVQKSSILLLPSHLWSFQPNQRANEGNYLSQWDLHVINAGNMMTKLLSTDSVINRSNTSFCLIKHKVFSTVWASVTLLEEHEPKSGLRTDIWPEA
jgi:hypothetical protein